MPGDNLKFVVELIAPIAMDEVSRCDARRWPYSRCRRCSENHRLICLEQIRTNNKTQLRLGFWPEGRRRMRGPCLEQIRTNNKTQLRLGFLFSEGQAQILLGKKKQSKRGSDRYFQITKGLLCLQKPKSEIFVSTLTTHRSGGCKTLYEPDGDLCQLGPLVS